MAPKAKDGKEEEDDILQAVIIADSFNSRFKPLSHAKPRTLLPLCNIPLLDWTLEALVSSGVQQVFVVCSSHPEQIRNALSASRWSLPNSGINIVSIVSPSSRSVGDVMRELDSRQVLTSDFILVTGDVVSTIPIQDVVREHKERRKINKDCIMTMVMKPAGPRETPKPGLDSSLFLIDSNTQECLYYEHVRAGKTRLALPREKMANRLDLDVRTDLYDCSIDVCSVDVPALFSENFDYQELRADFVHGVLTSDILGKTIYIHTPKTGYAARVRDTKSYATISHDVLSRKTFPLVPDDTPAYRLKRGHVYIGEPVDLSRTCILGSHTQVGPQTRIDDDTKISHSVIGPDCSIGRGVTIKNSYIWGGVTIGSNSVIEQSIIGDDVIIGEGSKIAVGCLVGEGTQLGKGANLPPFCRIASGPYGSGDDDWDDEEEKANGEDAELVDESIVGVGAKAYIWPAVDDEAAGSDDESERETPATLRFARLGDTGDDLEDPESEISSVATSSAASSPPGSPSSIHSSQSSIQVEGSIPTLLLDSDTDAADFLAECTQSLERAFEEGHTVENAAIELKTLRMATNVPLTSVKEVVIGFMIGQIPLVENAAEQKKEVNKMIGRWGDLVVDLGGENPVETLFLLQEYCISNPTRVKIFGLVLAAFYNEDVVDEDDIKSWIMDPKAKYADEPSGNACWRAGVTLFKALQAQDDSDEESD